VLKAVAAFTHKKNKTKTEQKFESQKKSQNTRQKTNFYRTVKKMKYCKLLHKDTFEDF